MDRIVFKYRVTKNFLTVLFELPEGPISPMDLRGLEHRVSKASPNIGVVISGRGPIWLYATLSHIYHPALWVAIFDPRLGGGVVAATHTSSMKVGDIVSTEGLL